MGKGARLCAVIALFVGAVAPPAADAAIPQLPVRGAEYAGVSVQRDVKVRMSDGVELVADVNRPATADGKAVTERLPVILTVTPYNKFISAAEAALVQRGYVVVVADARGTGGSPGAWESFGPREQQDTLDLLAWARGQPWSNGDLAMTGPSYMAINQLLAAERRPPGLKAIFPIVPAGDIYRDVVWHGGQVDAGFIPLWMGLVLVAGAVPPTTTFSDLQAALTWLTARLTSSLSFPINTIAGAITGADVAFDGPFYTVRSPLTHIDQIEVPTFVVGGWWDIFQRSEPTIYERLRMSPGRKQLLMGPWYHATPFLGGDTKLGRGPNTPQSLTDLQILWFDRWLKGRDNGIDDTERFGPVTSYELGAETWRREAKWPLPHDDRRLYLAPGGKLQDDAPASEGTKAIPPNPLSGLCARTTAQWTAGLVDLGGGCTGDNRNAERGAATFTTAPLTSPTQIAGPIAVHLRGSTSGSDGYWVAELTDVAPNGRSTQITAGFLQMSRRALDQRRSVRNARGDLTVPFHPFTKASLLPVKAGKPESLDIEIFNTNAILAPGHRLRLVLRSSDLPHALPGLPDLLPGLLTTQTVHMTRSDPSYVNVPIVDRSLANRGCVPRKAAVTGRGIGRARIGGSLKALERRYRVTRRRNGTVRFCARGGGRFLVRASRGRIVFVASTARGHKTKRVAPGKRVRGASRGFRRVARGLYLTRRAGPGRVAYGVRKGRARYVAVVRKRDAKRLARTLRRVGLR
jgi:hypothetical protein